MGSKEGEYLKDLQKPWLRVRKAAGLDGVRIHDLRHSCASETVMGSEGLPMVGKILSRALAQTTARSAHLADSPLQCALDHAATSLKKAMGRLGELCAQDADFPTLERQRRQVGRPASLCQPSNMAHRSSTR